MTSSLYDRDFYLWLKLTAQQLREKEFDQIDINNLIEEIESMGRSEKRELSNRLIILMFHLLKWKYQPSHRSSSWSSIVSEQQIQIESLLLDSPSLNNYLEEIFNKCYQKAREKAAKETKLSILTFPEENIFSVNNALNFDFSDD